jgi:hypothetical protein
MARNLADELVFHAGFGPAAPAAATPDFINVAEAMDAAVVLHVKNTTTVTGSAVTLTQATSAAGTTNAALGFDVHYANTDPANTSILTKVSTASNTFTTTNTNSAEAIYVIPVDMSRMDKANSYTFLRVSLANAVNSVISAQYVVRPYHGGNAANNPNLTN